MVVLRPRGKGGEHRPGEPRRGNDISQYGTGYGASRGGGSTSGYSISTDDYGTPAGQAVGYGASHQIVKISTDIIRVGTVSLANVIGVVVWFAIFVVLSTFAVRSTAETV